MLLEALKALDQEARLPHFYALQRVGYRIDLDARGHLVSFSEISRDAPRLSMPDITRTSKAVPLPVDRGDYVLGIPAKGKTQQSAHERHVLWEALLDELFVATGVAEVAAVKTFAASVNHHPVSVPEGFDPSRFIAIYVSGVFFADDERVRSWWRDRQLSGAGATADTSTQCSVCGNVAPVVENVTTQVRGLSGIGGKSKMALVSGNVEVFERHGLLRASGASICAGCGEATHQALNRLISDPIRSRQLGPSRFLWWTTEPTDDFIGALLEGDSEDAVREVFDALLSGRSLPSISTARFYAVSVGANVNRVVVRSWIDVTLTDAISNARSWLDRIAIVDFHGDRIRRPGVWSLIASLASPGPGSPLSRVSPPIIDDVMRSALTGEWLPVSVLAQLLERLRAEQGSFTTPRASLLKAFLSQQDKEAQMTELDLKATDPPYLCGRLLALLDDASRLATSANNSLVDRSYAAASTMPGLTFPRLLRLHRAHIDKLQRDRPGAAYRLQESVERVMSPLNDFPRTFSPSEQGRFAIGLYHQQAADRGARSKVKTTKTENTDDVADGDTDEQE
jgi:CRISPR-associated protein Csd1